MVIDRWLLNLADDNKQFEIAQASDMASRI